jgi:RHS repeat-associated protein
VFDQNDVDVLIGIIADGGFTEDLNGDGQLNHLDTQLLDLNGDGVHDAADMNILIQDVIGTLMADGNLDGAVDVSDFNIWINNIFTNGDWLHGDYNLDGSVDISDYNVWNGQQFTYAANFDPNVTEHIFGYTGRMFDTATGLQNNLNRWYDAKAGRWISEDPISFAAGDANIYRYVGNGPTNWADPDGLKFQVLGKTPEETRQKYRDTLHCMSNSSPGFKKVIDAMEKCPIPIIITPGPPPIEVTDKPIPGPAVVKDEEGRIWIYNFTGDPIRDPNGHVDEVPPEILMAHELSHVHEHLKGQHLDKQKAETQACLWQNAMARRLGLDMRFEYEGDHVDSFPVLPHPGP